MAKMVQIQSSLTIKVTTGLQNIDVSNPEANIPDRLKVNPQWPKHQILIREGAHLYPAEILDWNSVKSLAADKLITIGSTQDVNDNTLDADTKKAVETAVEAKQEFKLGTKGIKGKTLTLNDLVEETK